MVGLSNYTFLIPFAILLSGSIFLGYLGTNFFSSLDTLNLDLEYIIYNEQYSIIVLLPFLLPIFAIFILFVYYQLYNRSPFTGISYKLYSIFNRQVFIYSFFNYFFVRPSFISSFHFSYKFLDRGFLEYLGPLALFRLFFYLPSQYNMPTQIGKRSEGLNNIAYLFFYFFISIFILFIPLYL